MQHPVRRAAAVGRRGGRVLGGGGSGPRGEAETVCAAVRV